MATLALPALIALVFFYSGHSQSSASTPATCLPKQEQHYLNWTQDYFDSADVVFVGTVVSAATSSRRSPGGESHAGGDPANNATMAELVRRIGKDQDWVRSNGRFQLALFEVTDSWKGVSVPTIVTKADLYFDDTGYYPTLHVGETYLVFAFGEDPSQVYSIPVGCSTLRADEESAARIRVLDALIK